MRTPRDHTATCWSDRRSSASKKIKFFTNENVGDGKLELPEKEMHTTGLQLTPRTPADRIASFFSKRPPEWNVRLAARPGVHRYAALDVRRTRPRQIDWRAPAVSRLAEIQWEEAASPEATAALFAEKEFFEPNLYLYDADPGGIGFSEPLYRAHNILLAKSRELIAACPCENGCPSCVGPVGERGERAKEAAMAILSCLGA